MYSEREGTPAAKMPQEPKEIRSRRAAQIAELIKAGETEFLTAQRGKTYRVYLEEEEDGWSVGHTSNYIKVYTRCNSLKKSVNLKIGELYKEGVKAYE